MNYIKDSLILLSILSSITQLHSRALVGRGFNGPHLEGYRDGEYGYRGYGRGVYGYGRGGYQGYGVGLGSGLVSGSLAGSASGAGYSTPVVNNYSDNSYYVNQIGY